jgi:predicted DNA-binding transcriptional regulator YafY
MPKQAGKIGKAERILSVYYLLTHCEEVSMREMTGLLPGCTKTFSRDIALLKKAGVPVRYSARRRAFVLAGEERGEPGFSEGKKEQIFLEKIRRLATVMDEIPDDDCDKWYGETFPHASKRTMQRDFATLNAIGYNIKYERKLFNTHDAGADLPPKRYYCDRLYGAYELITFKRGNF